MNPFINYIDKSKGLAFTIRAPFLGRPIKFYHGLHSYNSYIGRCCGKLFYLSGVACCCHFHGETGYAKETLFRFVIKNKLITL